MIYHPYASFTGSSSFIFPSDSNITLHVENDHNISLAYWIVDGEISWRGGLLVRSFRNNRST